MTTFRIFGAAIVLSAAVATPVLAQPALSEPGSYAFYHPNSDLGLASSRRPSDALASQRLRDNGDIAGVRMAVSPHKRRAAARHY